MFSLFQPSLKNEGFVKNKEETSSTNPREVTLPFENCHLDPICKNDQIQYALESVLFLD